MKGVAAAAILAAAMLLGGCQDYGRVRVSDWPPSPVDRVDEIVVRLTPPAPVNWDESPGPDGFQVQVNFFQRDEPLSVTVKGTLEFALYEGRPTSASLADTKPYHTWEFDGLELTRCAGRSIVGWGYGMRLPWGPKPPPFTTGTLVARYRPVEGSVRAAQPLQVALSPK